MALEWVVGGAGDGQNGSTEPFNGSIAEFRIWKKAHSDEDIQRLMNMAWGSTWTAPVAPDEGDASATSETDGGDDGDGDAAPEHEGLLGYWPLAEGSGVTVHDVSPHHHHGLAVGFEWVEVRVRALTLMPDAALPQREACAAPLTPRAFVAHCACRVTALTWWTRASPERKCRSGFAGTRLSPR